MVGFPYYFGVPAGHPVLQHPLYLKYNVLTLDDIINQEGGILALRNTIRGIMLTNDNMAILYYLGNIVQQLRNAGADV